MSDLTQERIRIAYMWFGTCGAKNSATTVEKLYTTPRRGWFNRKGK